MSSSRSGKQSIAGLAVAIDVYLTRGGERRQEIQSDRSQRSTGEEGSWGGGGGAGLSVAGQCWLPEIWNVRSRLYRIRFLQLKIHFAVVVEVY